MPPNRPASTLVSVITPHCPAVTNAIPRLPKPAFWNIHSGENSYSVLSASV